MSSSFAHQFDSVEQQHDATQLGMWVFIAQEILVFGGLFLVYTVYRFAYPKAFAQASHHLDVTLGAVNTVWRKAGPRSPWRYIAE